MMALITGIGYSEKGYKVNGLEFSLEEIDEELRSLIPDLRRRSCTPRVMAEVDSLLDQRNELTYLMGELAIEELLDGR